MQKDAGSRIMQNGKNRKPLPEASLATPRGVLTLTLRGITRGLWIQERTLCQPKPFA